MFGKGSLAKYLPPALALAAALTATAGGCGQSRSEPVYNIGFNFHVVGMDMDQAGAQNRVKAMVDVVKRLLKTIKFEVDSTEIRFHNSPAADRLTNIDVETDADGNGWPDDMEELLTWSSATPNKNIDVFLVKSIGDIGILGAAGNIPGPPEKGTKHSGILMNTFGGLNRMTAAELELQGATLTHEMIHYLGVYHTTEREGLDFDYLKDTPECPQWTFDTNRDGLVSPNECYGQDGPYLMFWAAGRYPQEKISAEEVSVIKVHPLARKK